MIYQLTLPQDKNILHAANEFRLEIKDKYYELFKPMYLLSISKIERTTSDANFCIFYHNEAVTRLILSYSYCMAYYNNGIPDNPIYVETNDGGRRQWPKMDFSDFGRLFWFNYYSENVYIGMSGLWDNFLNFLCSYCNVANNIRDKKGTIKKLGKIDIRILKIFEYINSSPIYQAAIQYRNDCAHNVAAHKMIDENKYRYAADILSNIEQYVKLSGENIQKIISVLPDPK